MIVVIANHDTLAINENGTVFVRCPICDTWGRAQVITRHLTDKHPHEQASISFQARQKILKERG